MQVGIMGGAFNPIHYGHLFIAEYAFRNALLDRVLFIPTAAPAHRQSIATSFFDRLQMVKLAIADNEYFAASDIENLQTGKSYSYNTIMKLLNSNSRCEYNYIIGYDNFLILPTWYRIEELLHVCKFIVLTRGCVHNEQEIWRKLPDFAVERIKFLTSPNLEISSSYIREQLKKGGAVRYLMPSAVLQYIKDNQLYEKKQHY